jgi:hypothetical protein
MGGKLLLLPDVDIERVVVVKMKKDHPNLGQFHLRPTTTRPLQCAKQLEVRILKQTFSKRRLLQSIYPTSKDLTVPALLSRQFCNCQHAWS